MITKNELLSRVYDKLFDMVGFSENHVPIESDIEIIDQSIEGDKIDITILENGKYRDFSITIEETTHD